VTTEAPPDAVGANLRHLGDSMSRVVEALLDRKVGLADAMAAFELCYLRAAVKRGNGSFSQTANELGIHRNTLRSKLRRNGGRGDQSPSGRAGNQP
jgi:DNA-binding NtrC family response regulator